MSAEAPTTTSTTSPSLANIPPLPTELLEQILLEDVLEQGDLAACCLVSRRMRTIAEPLLYAEATVEVRIKWGQRMTSSRTSRWLSTVDKSERLAALVRVLRIVEAADNLVSLEPVGDNFPPIGFAVGTCDKLERIDCPAARHYQLDDFPPFAFPSQATLRSLDRFTLRNEDDWAFLLNFPNLTHLGLDLGGCGRVRHAEDDPRPDFRLKSLSLINFDEDDPRTGPDKSLLDALLRLSHDSLEKLVIPSTRHFSTHVNLDQFPNLGHLTLTGRWTDTGPDGEDVHAAVAHLSGCRAVESLVLLPIIRPGDGHLWRNTLPVLLAAVPPSVKALETAMPLKVDLVDEVLGWLPSAVKLEELGVRSECFDPGYANPRRCAADCAAALLAAGAEATTLACSYCRNWAGEARLWAALKVHLAAKGIELVTFNPRRIS